MNEIKKTIIYYLLISMLCFSSFSGATTHTKTSTTPLINTSGNQNYSHTVFAGVGFSQTCGPCHNWSLNMYNAYNSGNYDFEYVSMIVFDENGHVLNDDAYNWSELYNIGTFPTSIFDGDYQKIVGDHAEQLPGALDACGNRSVVNITANITLSWLGNATINTTVTVQNNEATQYSGNIRAFITENISRYETSLGDPFRFGFLDFAFDENISINAGGIYTNYTVWNGNEHQDNHGDDFGDIIASNIQVVLVIYNNSDGYVDETVMAYLPNNPPNVPSNPHPEDGETDVDVDVNLSWNCSDPDSGTLKYDVYFGNVTPPPLIASNITELVYDLDRLNFNATYFWKIIAWDYLGASNESPIWNFTTRDNNPPNPYELTGPSEGFIGVKLTYNATAKDPEEDQIYYWFDWGDGTNSGWLGPYMSNETVNQSHTWFEIGKFEIKVKAKDIYDAESDWSDPLILNISGPQLEIFAIMGGFFDITAIIRNVGNLEATNVNWNISLEVNLIFRGKETTGTIPKISPGEYIAVKSDIIIGLGKTIITVIAEMKEQIPAEKSVDGFLLGVIVWIKP